MWLAIRLVLAAIGFAIRQRRRRALPASAGVIDGVAYFEAIHKSKRQITGFTIGMQRRSPTWIQLHAESSVDRFCKWLGIANELQTGEPRFDDAVYVTCDHPHVHAVLRESSRLRDAVLAALEAGFSWIRFDGTAVRMYREAEIEPGEHDLRLLKDVWAAAGVLEQPLPSRLADRFLWKALVVEGAIWSLAGYSIGALVQWVFVKEDYHLWDRQVVALGGMVAIAAFVVLLAAIVLWMRGSSRGHRVIVESAIILAFGLPLGAIQLVGDSNRALDDAPSVFVQDTVVRCETRVHRRKRSTYYTYHLHLAGTQSTGPQLPGEVGVPRQLCALSGKRVDFELGPGRWGIPWYREIRIDDTRWRPTL